MQKRQVRYHLSEGGSFVIDNYNFAKPFSSFFPGIAGLYGIPMWVFFVNRGQGICSFGTDSKDHSIAEFLPANKAYQMVFQRGFRTFIKIKKAKNVIFYEPFHDSLGNAEYKKTNRVIINASELRFEEYNQSLGINVFVDYFTVPNDKFAALGRIVTVENAAAQEKDLEIIDGLPVVIPYGVSDLFIKYLSRTIEAWMGVENLSHEAPFYRLRVDPTDRPEVIHIEKGNFYVGFYQEKNTVRRARSIVDPECVFGVMGDTSIPCEFLASPAFRFPSQQITRSKTPSAFSFMQAALKKNQRCVLYSLIGTMDHLEKLNKNLGRIASVEYMAAKQEENRRLLDPIMQKVACLSSSPTFDLYAQRTFLDNILRGGLPITLNHQKKEIVYVYSRKHGDLERDYNKFVTQPTYFSQGNGNYRDMNQNRRNDIYFNTALGAATIKTFFNLIQLDGFNPLVVKGVCYHLEDSATIRSLVEGYTHAQNRESLQAFLSKKFSIGELFMFLEEHDIRITHRDEFIADVLRQSIKHEEAEHKEGFWIDHWTYNLDLLESYLSMYPEEFKTIIFDDREFSFYDDCWIVNPRSKKYILHEGVPKQLKSVAHCQEKQALIEARATEPHKVRTDYGKGKIYATNLFEKNFCIIVNKLASLDPCGVGIEMEANKPGWYDALNGLPGLFGSSSCETMELKRLVLFFKRVCEAMSDDADSSFAFAEEIVDFYAGLDALLKEGIDAFAFWDRSNTLKEQFREKTVFGLSGTTKTVRRSECLAFFERALQKLERGITAAQAGKKDAYVSYFINEVSSFEKISEDKEGVYIRPLAFRQKPLALFLEAFVHAFKIAETYAQKKRLYAAVRSSALYDKELKMYKVNAPLKNEPEEIGRCRVFTPGWLENESIWVHMEYKFLLELLRGGLYEEFYTDFFQALIPFQKAERYGRSILENSSFIVSSVFPDKKLHGNGFVARLSGSTCEFIHIWLLMNLGSDPFFIDGSGKLALRFRPILSKELFTKKQSPFAFSVNGEKMVTIEKNCYAFVFLGTTLVVYHNPLRRSTYGKNSACVKKIILADKKKESITLDSAVIPEKYAYKVRSGEYARIDIYLA